MMMFLRTRIDLSGLLDQSVDKMSSWLILIVWLDAVADIIIDRKISVYQMIFGVMMVILNRSLFQDSDLTTMTVVAFTTGVILLLALAKKSSITMASRKKKA